MFFAVLRGWALRRSAWHSNSSTLMSCSRVSSRTADIRTGIQKRAESNSINSKPHAHL